MSGWLQRRESVIVQTPGRGMLDLSGRVHEIVARSGVHEGLCSVFVHHTSASLILCENADPQVRRDLEAFASRLVPDGDRLFEHVATQRVGAEAPLISLLKIDAHSSLPLSPAL